MSKKIRPNLGLSANKDGNAMMKALEDGARATTAPLAMNAMASKEATPETSLGGALSAAALKVGEVYDLPLNMLARSDNNARVFYNPGEVEEMAESLASNGQEIPVVGYVKDGSVVVVDGQKRFNACALGKIPSLKVLIRAAPGSAADEYEASRRINEDRSTQTAFDDAVRWQELLERGAYASQDDLAARLKKSKASISKTLGLNRIPGPLRRMMADHPQTSTLAVAYEISAIFSNLDDSNAEQLEAIAEEIIKTVIKKGLGREQTIELVRSKMQGPKTRVRGDSVQVKFGTLTGAINVVASRGEFTMNFRGLSEDEIEDLKRRVESVLAGQLTM